MLGFSCVALLLLVTCISCDAITKAVFFIITKHEPLQVAVLSLNLRCYGYIPLNLPNIRVKVVRSCANQKNEELDTIKIVPISSLLV